MLVDTAENDVGPLSLSPRVPVQILGRFRSEGAGRSKPDWRTLPVIPSGVLENVSLTHQAFAAGESGSHLLVTSSGFPDDVIELLRLWNTENRSD